MKITNLVLSLPCPDVGYRGPFLEPRLGAGHDGGRLVAGPLAMGSGRPQPKAVTWAYHLQGSGAKSFGWQSKAGTLAVRSLDAEPSSRDVESHLSDGEGGRAGVLG